MSVIKSSIGGNAWKIWVYVFLVIMAILILFPLVNTVSQSFMTNREVNVFPPRIFPIEPTIDSYVRVITQADVRLDLWLRNSMFAAAAYTIAVLSICSPAAYAFSRLSFPGKNVLFAILLVTIMIPGQVTLIPNFLLLRDLKWLDTFYALVLPGAANVFGLFLLRQFFMQIPRDIEEAVVLDGGGYYARFRHAILPLSTSVLAALSIFVFLGHYNDLFWPLIVTNTLETRTLPVGLSIIQSSYAGQFRPMILAGAVLSFIPILVVFILFQRHIIKGVVTTGMGGR